MRLPSTNPAYQRGSALFNLKRYDAALREFQEALRQNSADVHAATMIALCQSNLRRPKAAREAAEQAIRINPFYPGGHHALAWTFFADNRFRSKRKGDIPATKFVDNAFRYRLKLADRAIDEALRLNPRYVNYLLTKAQIALADFRPQDALKAVESALAINPLSSDCLRIRSHILRQVGNLEEAKAASDSALASSPESALNHETAGWTALAAGDFSTAHHHFAEALRLDPLQPGARRGFAIALRTRFFFYRHLARAWCALGRNARKWLRGRPIRIALASSILLLTISKDALPTRVSAIVTAATLTIGAILIVSAALHILASYCLEFDESARPILTTQGRPFTYITSILILFFITFALYTLLAVKPSESPSPLITLLLLLACFPLVILPPFLYRRLSRRRLTTLSPSEEMP